MSLNNFFDPKTIAIVGASDHLDKVGGILLKKAIASSCRIIPVNPKHDRLLGIKCYKKIEEYGSEIDLAVIAVPKEFVLGVLEECGKKRIKNIILISAGFSEVGNIEDEKKLLDMAKQYNMKLLGPNCFGIFNSKINLDLTFSKETPKRGGIVFIAQSGALWSYMADLDFGFYGFIGLGNMADLSFEDWTEYFSDDKKVKDIVFYIEKLKDGKEFLSACGKALKNGKRLYAVKVGKSEVGKEAAFSHTASIASDFLVYKDIFKQKGIEMRLGLGEVLEEIEGKNNFYRKNPFRDIKKSNLGKKVFIITNAGGAGALASDYLNDIDFEVIEKPLDILGTALSGDYRKTLEKTNMEKKCDWILVILTPQAMTDIENTAKVIAEFKNKNQKEVAVLFLGEKSMKKAAEIFKKNKVLFFNSF